MTQPGWYHAAGDPPRTQRYWDGELWIGEPVPEPTPQPAGYPVGPPGAAGGYTIVGVQPASSTFPGSLKAIAIILSVLKAIPLVFGALGVLVLAALSEEIDDEFDALGGGFDSLLGAAIAVLLVMVLMGALLIGFQFVGALKERPIMVFIPALIMSLLDGLFTLAAWSSFVDSRNSFDEESPGGAVMMTAVAAVQVYVAVQAIRANGN